MQLNDATQTTSDVVLSIGFLELAARRIARAMGGCDLPHAKAAKSLDNTRDLGLAGG